VPEIEKWWSRRATFPQGQPLGTGAGPLTSSNRWSIHCRFGNKLTFRFRPVPLHYFLAALIFAHLACSGAPIRFSGKRLYIRMSALAFTAPVRTKTAKRFTLTATQNRFCRELRVRRQRQRKCPPRLVPDVAVTAKRLLTPNSQKYFKR
jgi:hypothetical protein